jgi:5-methyltetrahydrofolate--homocysteine methyltransferase
MSEKFMEVIFNAVLNGEKEDVEAGVRTALESGINPEDILNNAMISAMGEVGQLFEHGDYFVPEMLVAARAMQAGLAVLKPRLLDAQVQPAGKVVIGTVKGDLHDIGKNLVSMMLEGAGYEIIDLGTNVTPETFIECIQAHQPDIVGLSSLLTTTMPAMQQTIQALEAAGVRSRARVIVGGAPVTPEFAEKIGADGYAADASQAVTLVKSLLSHLP